MIVGSVVVCFVMRLIGSTSDASRMIAESLGGYDEQAPPKATAAAGYMITTGAQVDTPAPTIVRPLAGVVLLIEPFEPSI